MFRRLLLLFLQTWVRLFYRTLYRIQVEGLAQLPQCGPFIVAANHVSLHDPVLIGTFLHPGTRFMAKAELFQVPGLGRVIRRFGAFPVLRQGIGIGGIRSALRLLSDNQVSRDLSRGDTQSGCLSPGQTRGWLHCRSVRRTYRSRRDCFRPESTFSTPFYRRRRAHHGARDVSGRLSFVVSTRHGPDWGVSAGRRAGFRSYHPHLSADHLYLQGCRGEYLAVGMGH